MMICEGRQLKVSEALLARVDDNRVGGAAGGQPGLCFCSIELIAEEARVIDQL